AGLEAINSRLQTETVHGRAYWFSEADPPSDAEAPIVHLLSIYDEYVSSYKDYSAIVSVEDAGNLKGKGNALNYIIVLDGRVVGTWKRAIRTGTIFIETDAFSPLTEVQSQAVAAAAAKYGEFHRLPVVVT
ncbi:MAG TPA: crosslink repair DNA glycosylase YcaQ family protein, partial [Rhodothermia bacterium]|nr:crosslink repair DNA glycosylase YcaQ family protein [Rhodothermia bacterium]